MHVKHHKTCRICGNEHLTEVLDLGKMHFQGCFEKEGYPSPPKRKMENKLVRCDVSRSENACGLVQTEHSVSPEILYRNYWYESGISETMKNHLRFIVEKAIEITGFKKGSVVDIAANDFSLLRNYRDFGDFQMFAVDPSDISARQNDKDIILYNETFPTDSLSNKNISILTSIACFYDVNDPVEFTSQVKKILDTKGIWIFEVAYLPSILHSLSYDSIVNEHVLAWHIAPLERMLKDAGLKLFRADKTQTNGGSILCFVCHDDCDLYESKLHLTNLKDLRLQEFEMSLDEEKTYEEFKNRVLDHSINLFNLLDKIKRDGKSVHLYGSSTKMNTLIGYMQNTCKINITDYIQYAAERSPNKYKALTLDGIKILSEDESKSLNPDFYLVGPYHFKDEILKREDESIKNGMKFIFPLPELLIVD